MLRKIAIGTAIASVLFVAGSLAAIRYVGAWNLVFPNRTHETTPPDLPDDLARPAVLLFTKTNGFRHKDAIAAGTNLMEQIAAHRGWSSFHTENGAVFSPELLARFDAVVFHNASGDMLNDAQEAALIGFIEGGGGWFGTHAAGDGSHEDWTWYVEEVIGSPYVAHTMGPQFQEALVVVEDHSHPATRALPTEWKHTEEWYSWVRSPRESGAHVLARVDESSYEPWMRMLGAERDLRMGDHPILWTRCIGRGRVFYSALGHAAEAYDRAEIQSLIEGAMAWVIGAEGKGCGG